MNYKPAAGKRLGALIGAIFGVLAMLICIAAGLTLIGAVLLILLTGMGLLVGTTLEKYKGEETNETDL